MEEECRGNGLVASNKLVVACCIVVGMQEQTAPPCMPSWPTHLVHALCLTCAAPWGAPIYPLGGRKHRCAVQFSLALLYMLVVMLCLYINMNVVFFNAP